MVTQTDKDDTNKIYLEINFINMCVKFHLYPPHVLFTRLSKIDPFFTLFSHDGNISNPAICKKSLDQRTNGTVIL